MVKTSDSTASAGLDILHKMVPIHYDQLMTSPKTVLISKKGQKDGYRETDAGESGCPSKVKPFTSKPSGLFMPSCHFIGQNVWILKPTGLNRGKGIHVVNSISKLKKLIKEYSRGKDATLMGSTMTPGGFPVSSKFMDPQPAICSQQHMLTTMQAGT